MKECNQCGKCCIKYGGGDLAVTQEEIDLWEIFNPEIFAFVKNNDIWFDPQSGKQLKTCPFLEITPQVNRPEDCRHYPSLIAEMIRDECEMIDVTDLTNPAKSQKQLDILMNDSRPSSSS